MARTSSNIAKLPLVGSVNLYGTHATGAGWFADGQDYDGNRVCKLGTGEPKPGINFTAAVWTALLSLKRAGTPEGRVRIHIHGGRFADTTLDFTGYFGELKFSA